MDIVAIVGLIIAIAGLSTGMVLKGVSFDALLNPAAILIIIVGTIGAVTIATPGEKLKNLPSLFGILFGKSKSMKREDAVELLVEYTKLARKEGLLALEKKIPEIKDPFIAGGIQLMIDGASSDIIEERLNEEIAAMEERHMSNAQIFTQAGTYAPTLGVLGAVIGLIAALKQMSDTEALGHAISAAFVATLLGIFTGYVIWHPFANRLKQKSKIEVNNKRMLLEGILGLSAGQNYHDIQERMLLQVEAKKRNIAKGE